MPNARLIIDNVADDATITLTTGTEIATMPVAHLQLNNKSRSFRTNDKDIELIVSLAQSAWISALSLWRVNLTGTATVAITALDVHNNVVYDSGFMPAFETKTLNEMLWGIDPLAVSVFTGWRLTFSVFWFALVVAKTIKIRIKDLDNPEPLELNRLYIGYALEPEYNFTWGDTLTWQDKSKSHNTAGGSSYSVESEVWRESNLQLNNITEADRPHFSEAFRKVGTQKDWFVSLYPEAGGQLERDYTFATKCKKSVTVKRENGRFYQAKLSLREA